MNVSEKINQLASESVLLNNVPCVVTVRLPWGEESSTTVVLGCGSYELRPAAVCPIEERIGETRLPIPVDFKGVVAIHRMWISIGAVCRASDSVERMEQALRLILEGGVEDLQNQIGSLYGYKLTTKGPDGKYFKLLENVNGYELLLYAIKE